MNATRLKTWLPTQLKYLLLVSFCLMTLIPMLAGAFAAMLIMQAAQYIKAQDRMKTAYSQGKPLEAFV